MARKKANIHYIYKTVCLITGRYYIGMHSTNNIDDGYMGSGKRLRRSIRKYGKDSHIKEILEFFENRELLIEAEKKSITPEMITDINCMNLKGGGEGGYISEEQQRHRSKCAGLANSEKRKQNKEFDIEYRKKISDKIKKLHSEGIYDTVIRIGFNFNNKYHTLDTKNKMSEVKKGKYDGIKNPSYGTCWVTKNGINKKIKKEDYKDYLNNGWMKGRII
jgi:hypothetical protein